MLLLLAIIFLKKTNKRSLVIDKLDYRLVDNILSLSYFWHVLSARELSNFSFIAPNVSAQPRIVKEEPGNINYFLNNSKKSIKFLTS